jgi:hypothetical protein
MGCRVSYGLQDFRYFGNKNVSIKSGEFGLLLNNGMPMSIFNFAHFSVEPVVSSLIVT